MSAALNPAESIFSKLPWLKYVLHGVGGGTAVILALAAMDVLKTRPEFLPQLLTGGAVPFAALIVCAIIFDRRLGQFTELQLRHVIAQEQLAANVGAVAVKDDTRGQALEAAVRYNADATRKIADDVKQIIDLLNGKAPGGANGR